MNVYLEGRVSGWQLHSLYDSLIDFPPDGVRFSHDEPKKSSGNGSMLRYFNGFVSNVQPLKPIIDHLKPSIYYGFYRASRGLRTIPSADLIYSSQHLIFEPIPWVVDLEFVTGLVGYGRLATYRRVIEKSLASKFCKKILPWTDAAKETLLLGLECNRFEEKIETVHLAVSPKNFVKSYQDNSVRLLFVGTGNRFNQRKSFELKGGREVLAAFARLRRKYRNVTLTMRSAIPPRYREFCVREGVQTLPDLLTPAQLRDEFERADIFVFPAHQTPGSVILDAMSYELPVVATDVWAMNEMVSDGKTGFLTRPSRFAKYHGDNFVPLWGEPGFQKLIERIDSKMIDDIVTKVSYLIEDPRARREMGKNGRKLVEQGEFSIATRNRKLLRIFEESLNN